MTQKTASKVRGFILDHFLWHMAALLVAWLFSASLEIWLIFFYIYLAMLAAVSVRELFLYWRRRQIAKYARRSERTMTLLLELIDLAYVYDSSPDKFYAGFRECVSAESLDRRGIIDPDALLHNARFRRSCENLRREDARLLTLLREGITNRELKVIYGLKDINSVYVKISRLRGRLDKRMKDLLDDRER